MNQILVPFHQFEIRFSQILSFSKVKEAISPYVKLFSDARIENENTHLERIILPLEEISCVIFIYWDKVLIRFDYLKLNLLEKNSILENIFFKIFKTITESVVFGEIKNILYFKIYTYIFEDSNPELILSEFINKNIKDDFATRFSNYKDLGISAEFDYKGASIQLGYEKLTGEESFRKKNIFLNEPNLLHILNSNQGELLEFKYFELTKNVTLDKYKSIHMIDNEHRLKIWKV